MPRKLLKNFSGIFPGFFWKYSIFGNSHYHLPVGSEWIWFDCLILIKLRLKLRIWICKSLIHLSKLPLALTTELLSTSTHLTSWIVSLINWTGCDLFWATKSTSATWCLAWSKCMIVVGGWRRLKCTTLLFCHKKVKDIIVILKIL